MLGLGFMKGYRFGFMIGLAGWIKIFSVAENIWSVRSIRSFIPGTVLKKMMHRAVHIGALFQKIHGRYMDRMVYI